ncbi:aminotransferase class I/II-fold pyridoxal phosphate-dependent enzyme [Nocardia sp. CDC159]|uniref:Aminotransferase class I/II-fold pyridoxal phosphate-dependent enzyme n=1 Tax=Nocardia pulmonis TaxID=2951408 RepID=A0A9X2EBU8_9NOCA|nr:MULTISPECIES: aminotransferase class I/II-fold pyridoxal phosphate-dependent enzyme [Nocardia]MCM6777486.1 aminotransferase class I/II-fold pyridoxal phosphate-dependent enzyme [Nocardia pulmonis]MCM6790407.1 aminotransferase class I/II-fold pyridoxal phosphate-dependent enzyme [Nocardia sp. CDC159]
MSRSWRTEPMSSSATVRYDLSLSENPFPPLPSVLHAVQRALGRANRYPEFLPRRLPRIIAAHLGVRAEQVAVGAGATGVVLQIMRALTDPGGRMVCAAPTFDGYPILADMVGMETVGIPLDSSGRQDLWAMARAVDSRTALVAVCRPHNPTGTVVAAGELRAFLFGIPRRVPVVLDEAYVEFLGATDTLDRHELIARYPNLLVVRTFSKAYGLAGLRIGYAFGAEELVRRVLRLQLPFGVPETAVAAVAASYAAEAELAERVLRIATERERLRIALRRCGIRVPRGRANFLYLPGPGIVDRLARAGIAAKGYPDGSARIAVGDPAADAAVRQALGDPDSRGLRRVDSGLRSVTVRDSGN